MNNQPINIHDLISSKEISEKETATENQNVFQSETTRALMYFKSYKNMEKNDGYDHIRIDRHAQTPLGHQLMLSYNRTFYMPVYGSFCSMQSALEWLRLRDKDDNIRSLTDKHLVEYVKEQIAAGKNEYDKRYIEDELYEMVLEYSVKANPKLLKMMLENELPYCNYYVVDGKNKIRNIQYTNILEKFVRKVRSQKPPREI